MNLISSIILPIIYVLWLNLIRQCVNNYILKIVTRKSPIVDIKSSLKMAFFNLIVSIRNVSFNIKFDYYFVLILSLLHIGIYLCTLDFYYSPIGLDGTLILISCLYTAFQFLFVRKYGAQIEIQKSFSKSLICLCFLMILSLLLRMDMSKTNLESINIATNFMIYTYRLLLFVFSCLLLAFAKMDWPGLESMSLKKWTSSFAEIFWLTATYVICFSVKEFSISFFSYHIYIITLILLVIDLVRAINTKKATNEWVEIGRKLSIPVGIVCVFAIWLGSYYV